MRVMECYRVAKVEQQRVQDGKGRRSYVSFGNPGYNSFWKLVIFHGACHLSRFTSLVSEEG